MGESEAQDLGSDHKKLFIFGSLFTLLIIIVSVAILIVSRSNSSASVDTPKQVTAVIPTPSSEPVLDKSAFLFEVLNGAGVRGAASSAKESLQNKGYTVLTIGNADGSSYTTSQLYLSEDRASLSELMIADLQGEFPSIEYAGTLDEGSEATARLILGRDDVADK